MKRFLPAFLLISMMVLPADAQLFKTSLTLTIIDELGNLDVKRHTFSFEHFYRERISHL